MFPSIKVLAQLLMCNHLELQQVSLPYTMPMAYFFVTKLCMKFFHRTNILDVRIYFEELNYQYMEQVAQYTASQYGGEMALKFI